VRGARKLEVAADELVPGDSCGTKVVEETLSVADIMSN